MATSPRRWLAATACATVLALAALASPAAGQQAVHPSNRPTPLPGVDNGYVPGDRLITVAPGCRVARAAGPSLALLLRSATAAGVPIDARDCYRPVGDQVAVSRSWSSRGNSACAATPSTHPDGRPRGTSMHGWGKAVDVREAGGISSSSPGFRYLEATAGQLGWNHPGWAKPGGGPCPEPWHWEWVGDGGTAGAPPVPADVVAVLPGPADAGHRSVTGLGDVRASAGVPTVGSALDLPLQWVVVGAASTPDRDGYWLVAGDGGVFSFGTAGFFGSTGDRRLNAPVVGMAPTPDGRGYWLVAGDGGVFSFGTAGFFGSTGDRRLNAPVVGMAPTPDGRGYWLVAGDGGVFSFGSAGFFGSTGDRRLNAPVVGMAPTPDGRGYWLVAGDGGTFAFGTARFLGSAVGRGLASPVVGMAVTAGGDGQWLVTAAGTVVTTGTAP